MEWWQAILLGIVQGLTEFLPVSSSGHLMIFKELLGVDGEGFLDFTVTVHLATVLSTILVFWAAIRQLLKGLLQFRYNDETDYIAKICVSMIPVFVVGMFFKDQVESLFGENLTTVAVCLLVTAALLFFSDHFGQWFKVNPRESRNGISFLQAFVVGLGQACAVAPGLSRSGTTIAVGLISGVKRDVMAQFSFLMVLVPILGDGVSLTALALGFLSAFVSGLFACKVMVALVRKARLGWFALYCVIIATVLLIFA